ncbi:unnamed protein product [Kluyveromyces dobzhanskii CBS 2104]|uniref:WGS project CCBQ000000000 data, contig 00102 n=1 Tax=Kluyveromyces dobzhanskii CBS 2104 TaxID=1427455 RepID=A0A0A8L764_9SACH|nr:unnamed protein product [Kluyveromyces dobzhanskii CBS 2104]
MVGMNLFKKRNEIDPFAGLLDKPEGETEPQPEQSTSLLKRVTSRQQQEEADENEYHSPFRTKEQTQRARQIKQQKFPTSGAGVAAADPEKLGYSVNTDKSSKKPKDIAIPSGLKVTEAEQKVRLTALEKKEKQLRYWRESQQIVDLTEKEAAAAAAEAAAEGKVDASKETSSKDVDLSKEAEAEVKEEIVDQDAKPSAAAAVVEPFDAAGAEAGAEATTTDDATPAVPLVEEEGEENSTGVYKAPEDDANEYVDPSREAKPESAVRAFEEAEAIAQDDEEEAVVSETEPSPEEAVVALQEAEAIATENPEAVSPPPDINSLPRVPFNGGGATAASTGIMASGLFALFKRSKKPDSAAAKSAAGVVAPGDDAPVATPEDPEYIVRTEDGYVSKSVYDKLQYDENQHQSKLTLLSEKHDEKYATKAQEYEEKIKSIEADIAELDAQMEQLRLDHEEKLKLKQVETSQALLETNVKHINVKGELYKETEEIKTRTIASKDEQEVAHQAVQAEIDELLLLKEETAKENQEHESQVEELTAELDAKTSALNESLARKEETNAEIKALEEEKARLEQETKEAQEQHQVNVSKIESIDNKEYLPKVNEINTEISGLLASLGLIQQEIANQKVEFSSVTKRLEEERRQHEEQLAREKEERERAEAQRLEKQRAESEKQAEEARLKHEQEVARLKQTHDEALKEAALQREAAAKQFEEEQQKRQQAERERSRLQGEKAIAEQERGNPEDKKLAAAHEEKIRSQAEAANAVENTLQSSNRKATTAAAAPQTADSSLYDYRTEVEIVTID